MSNQPCRYCGIELIRWEKLPDGKYLRYDKNGLHKYDICKAEQLKRHKTSYQPNHIAKQEIPTTLARGTTSNYVGGTSTFPVDKEPEVRGVTINSLFVKTSNMEKEIKELRKQIETLASIADSIAQKTELVIQKIGYPKPEPIQSEAMKKLVESKEQVKTPFDPKPKTDESGVLLKDGQEIKAVQRHLSVDEINREMENKAFASKQEVLANSIKEQEPLQYLNKTDVMQWENLSEAFVCHNCEGKFHNGYMKLGTKLCEPCKLGIEANESESESDRSDVNSFVPEPESRPLRSIEDINDDI